MKILVVSQYFWPETFRINDLAAALVERGHDVVVLTGLPNYPQGDVYPGYGLLTRRRERYKGIEIMRVPLIPRGNGCGIRLALNYASFVVSSCIFSPFVAQGEFDVILVCQLSPVTVGLPALLLKRLKKIPILFWVLDLWPESLSATGAVQGEKLLSLVEKLVRFLYHGCDRIVVASKGFIPSIVAKGVPAERIGYLPNWNEPEYLDQHVGQVPVNLLPDGFRVLFAGNIGVAQDFGTILAAAEKLKCNSEIKWVILGDGRQYEWLKEQVGLRDLCDTVHLLGRHPTEAMPSFFTAADTMLVTLKRDSVFALTIPGKIQSYMACGKPIVAALDGEGRRVIIEAGVGFVSPAEDVNGLADAVLAMYRSSKEEREAMGRRGKAYCEANFDREMLMTRVEKWLGNLSRRG